MMRIKTWVIKFLQERLPDRHVTSNYTDDSSSKWYRYIQISVAGHKEKWSGLHYEFNEHEVLFHLEEDFSSSNYLAFRRFLQKATSGIEGLVWQDQLGRAKCCCKFEGQRIYDLDTFIRELNRLMDLLDPIINKALEEAPSLDRLLTHHKPTVEHLNESVLLSEKTEDGAKVRFVEGSFADLMAVDLNIPPYQRNYCWEDSNIENLWNTIASANGEIHLGNIILQERDGKFDVIDGQQRLITLSLFAMALGYAEPLPLLKGRMRSTESVNNIANAKSVVKMLCRHKDRNIRKVFAEKSGRPLKLGILVLNNDTNLDLAYTFFSSQNNKGVPLSDYDLLKAHHLQYIANDIQARHLASNWDRLVSADACMRNGEIVVGGNLKSTLGRHLLRLRRWMRLDSLPSGSNVVRDEFVAAPIVAAIPPFGERFDFYEKIQGGTHFFAYADEFVEQYRIFKNLDEIKVLDEILTYSSHRHYNDVIETLLFGYFLKFKSKYLAEAFFAISSVIADDRYASGQMRRKRLLEHARDSRIIMMIDQSTSPTFFLAEALNAIKINPLLLSDEELKGRRNEFYHELRKGMGKLMPFITEERIKNRIKDTYEL